MGVEESKLTLLGVLVVVGSGREAEEREEEKRSRESKRKRAVALDIVADGYLVVE